MKKYLAGALLLFASSIGLIVVSAHTYCSTRWILLALALLALALCVIVARQKDVGELGAITAVIFVASIVFNGTFFVIATRHCH